MGAGSVGGMTTGSVAARLARRLDGKGIHYGWVIAAVSFLTLITAAGFRSTVGVLIVPLQEEFGWSRATISAAVAINLVLYGLGGPFAAGLYDRFGIRRVIVIALATIALQLDPDDADGRALAARPALGRRERPCDRRHRRHARRGDREPLVQRPPGARDGHADRQQRHRPARVPPAARLDRHRPGLALRRAHRLDRRPRVHPAARRPLPPRQPGGGRPAVVRRSRRRPTGRPAESVPRGDRGPRAGLALLDVLAPHGQLLRLRRDHERAHRHAFDSGGDGPRHVRGHGGEPARRDRRLRPRRHALLGVAHRTASIPAGCSSGTTAFAASPSSCCRS